MPPAQASLAASLPMRAISSSAERTVAVHVGR